MHRVALRVFEIVSYATIKFLLNLWKSMMSRIIRRVRLLLSKFPQLSMWSTESYSLFTLTTPKFLLVRVLIKPSFSRADHGLFTTIWKSY